MSIKKGVVLGIVVLVVAVACVWLYLVIFNRCCAPPPVLPTR